MKLRNYQEECLKVIKDHFSKADKQLVQLPTGSGKTVIFLNYLKECSKRALVVCPSVELREQIADNAVKLMRRPVFCDKRHLKGDGVWVLTNQSLKGLHADFDTIVIDEAHHASADTYQGFIQGFQGKLLGLTATPERMDGKKLLETFGELTFKKSIFDLISEGYLCDVHAFRVKSGIEIPNTDFSGGDFKNSVLKLLNCKSRNDLIFETYKKFCVGKKTLIFCLNVEHAEVTAKALKDKGVLAAAIYGSMSKSKRKEIIEDFKRGKIEVLTNCQLLTEGFDEPSIKAIIMARPTRSKALYCQMVGRGLRLFPGKSHLELYELTDNNHRICTFNVLAGGDDRCQRDYKQGISLTELKKELDSIELDQIHIEVERFNLFENKFSTIPALPHQIDYLKKHGIYHWLPIRFEEAAFLIRKHKLGISYGYSY